MSILFYVHNLHSLFGIFSNASENNSEDINDVESLSAEKGMFVEAECDVPIKINAESEKNEKNNEQQSNCYW